MIKFKERENPKPRKKNIDLVDWLIKCNNVDCADYNISRNRDDIVTRNIRYIVEKALKQVNAPSPSVVE
jgi:hypothetical protein